MATAVAVSQSARTGRIPWYVWCCAAAVTSAIVGVQWDISWHRSIGRDTFWTPAHVAIYLCGVLAGVACGYLILSTSFDRESPLRQASVKMWGFRGPLGAFLAAWGGVAMLVSAPFDDWWHNAYGLDVKIISPPHTLLFLGNSAIQMGGILLTLGAMNRAEGELRRKLNRVFLYAGAMLTSLVAVFILAFSFPIYQHTGTFYRVACLAFPFVLVSMGRASHQRFACTRMAAIFMLLWASLIWILPLFPAEPKLGPVYQKVTHFIPPPFPLLLIVPAFFVDLALQKWSAWNRWALSAALGVAFLVPLLAVQWPFATFLLGPGGRNWFFGVHYLDYATRPTSNLALFRFAHWETRSEFFVNLAVGLAVAILLSRAGLGWGDSMRKVRR
jgi:hypothetical protein